MLMSDSELNLFTSIKTKKSKQCPHECRICGAPAEYSHFGVISCLSCKIFFRRNGYIKQTKMICSSGGHCEININTRHICTLCRLNKCFKCGMSTDLFRASKRIKTNTEALVKVQIQNRQEQFPTLNLLQSDSSLLSTNDWTLLSNLFNSYKESQLLSIGQRLMDIDNVIQSTNVIYQTLIQEFLTCTYEITGTYLRSNDDLCNLPSDDRCVILRSAADNVSCMGPEFILYHCHLFNLDRFSKAIETMYGRSQIDMHVSAMRFIDPDIVLVKLGLSLFAFTENTYSYSPNMSTNLTNPINILKIQNKYAEVTWKYLLYKYGHYQTVKRFLNLISWLEAATIYMFHIQNLTLHVNDVNSLVEKTELTLILDDADQIIETNKILS